MATHASRPRGGFPLIWLFFLVLIVASLWAWWRFGLRGEGEGGPMVERSPFDLPQPPKPDLPALPGSSAPGGRGGRPSGGPGTLISGGLPGVVPESRGGAAKGADAAKEQDFIKEHDAEIRKEQDRMQGIIVKYREKHPVVRKLNDEVMKMGRVVALTDQYHKDRNFYKWARGVMVLPEVKDAVKRYSADPAMWRAGVGMAVEALRHPPKAAIYTEMVKLFTTDATVSKPMSEMSSMVLSQLPAHALQIFTPGTNLVPLVGLATDLNPGGKLNLPPIPGVPPTVTNMNEYWRGYRDGYEDAIAGHKGIRTQRTL